MKSRVNSKRFVLFALSFAILGQPLAAAPTPPPTAVPTPPPATKPVTPPATAPKTTTPAPPIDFKNVVPAGVDEDALCAVYAAIFVSRVKDKLASMPADTRDLVIATDKTAMFYMGRMSKTASKAERSQKLKAALGVLKQDEFGRVIVYCQDKQAKYMGDMMD